MASDLIASVETIPHIKKYCRGHKKCWMGSLELYNSTKIGQFYPLKLPKNRKIIFFSFFILKIHPKAQIWCTLGWPSYFNFIVLVGIEFMRLDNVTKWMSLQVTNIKTPIVCGDEPLQKNTKQLHHNLPNYVDKAKVAVCMTTIKFLDCNSVKVLNISTYL